VGWSGLELRAGETVEEPGDPYSVVPVALTVEEVRSFYAGFSNAARTVRVTYLPIGIDVERYEIDKDFELIADLTGQPVVRLETTSACCS
jgi:trehalose-6-phosphate synthase